MADRQPWTVERIRALGATTDLVTAAAILGVGRSTGYALARSGRFPVPVIRVGARYIVPIPALLKILHAEVGDTEPDAAGPRLDPAAGSPVHGTRPADSTHPDWVADHSKGKENQ